MILLTLYSRILIVMHQQQTAFENIVGKGEIARYNVFYSTCSTQSDYCIPIGPYCFAPLSKDRDYIVLPLSVYASVCPSICPSVCLSVCTNFT